MVLSRRNFKKFIFDGIEPNLQIRSLRRGSNSRHIPYEGITLPTELHRHVNLLKVYKCDIYKSGSKDDAFEPCHPKELIVRNSKDFLRFFAHLLVPFYEHIKHNTSVEDANGHKSFHYYRVRSASIQIWTWLGE